MDNKPRARADSSAMQLPLLASQARMARTAHLGMDALAKTGLGSCDLLVAFLKNHPEAGDTLVSQLGVESETLLRRLERNSQEPPAEIPSLPVRLPPEMSDTRQRIISAPIMAAMRAAGARATDAGRETYSAVDVVACLITAPCEARELLLELSTDDLINSAASALTEVKLEEVDFMAAMQENMKKTLDAMWPQLRRSGRGDATEAARERAYEDNPERYDKSLVMAEELKKEPPSTPYAFEHYAGVFLHAAANEARLRHAPETQLDHMLPVLLQDGTASSQYLDARGVDRAAWKHVVDSELPRYPDGPKWPPNARDLGMNVPSGGREFLFKREIPDDLDLSKLSKEERAEYGESRPTGKAFTDLRWLVAFTKEEATIGYRLLTEAGITEDAIEAEIRRFDTGDDYWYQIKPDLAEALRNPKPGPLGTAHSQERACREAAEYEARARWAPEVIFDHCLMAILVDGTDTSAFVDALGIDRGALVRDLDTLLPRYEKGPYFPKPARNVRFIAMGMESPSSDLLVLWEGFDDQRTDEPSPGVELMRARGVTLAKINARLKELGVRHFRDHSQE